MIQVAAPVEHGAFDARLLGIAAAGIAVWRRAPVLVVVVLAAAVTALTRAFF